MLTFGGGLAYVVIQGCAIIWGAFYGLLLDFWVPFWAIPEFLGTFLGTFDFRIFGYHFVHIPNFGGCQGRRTGLGVTTVSTS